MSDRDLLNAILRQDFFIFLRKVFRTLSPGQVFVPDRYLEAITYQLDRIRRGEITRLIINMPPRSLKSMTASVAFPAFILGRDPTKRIVCASYSTDLSYKFSNDFRAVVNSDWYHAAFPRARVSAEKNTQTEIMMTDRGFRYATSILGTLTGFGGDIIIIDDPMKPVDAASESRRTAINEWFHNTAISRHDNKVKGAIIVVMQRVHMDDLTGFLLGRSDSWTVLNLPAIAEADEWIQTGPSKRYLRKIGDVLSPQREPLWKLEELRRDMGSDLFFAQYQQAPVPPGGAMIKRHWPKRYTSLPVWRNRPFIFQSWDTAAKGGPDNDWSVCTTWMRSDENQWYLTDLWRGRVDYPTLKAKVAELALQHRADEVLIEEAGTAIALIQELKFKVRGLIGIKPDRDKVTRMSVASAKFEAGQVFLPERASWLPDLEAELFAFPGSRYDDQVDSISQALNHDKSSLRTWIILGRDG